MPVSSVLYAGIKRAVRWSYARLLRAACGALARLAHDVALALNHALKELGRGA